MNFPFFSKSPEPPRCSFTKSHGHRCRMLPIDGSPFCFAHQPKPDDSSTSAELITAELTEAAGSLSTPEEIHNFLTRVTLLRIQGRLTPKESCAYAYLCQILQRGQREIAFHQKLRDERAQHEAEQSRSRNPFGEWSLPRPDRDGPVYSSQGADSSPSGSDTTNSEVEVSPASTEAKPSVGAGLARPALPESRPTIPARPSSSTDIIVELSPPGQPVSGRARSESTNKNTSAIPAPSAVQKSSKSSTLTSSTSRLPPDFYNHFFPIDPTLPPGLQDPSKNIPPPDEAECRRLAARRGLLFKRRPNSHGVFR